MTGQEIRRSYIEFFASRGHTVVPSSSVIPWDDPTLLFTNAGMNQFKDVFLGTGTRPYTRAVDTQKCIRAGGKHNDLEDVGRSPSHQTFFEMLGNWSFGDYYKQEAIIWAWELLTEVWKLPRERLWATVFREDDEAEELWASCTDVGRSRILRFDEKDNFWEMGDTGPCGPCSEISVDLGPERCRMGHDPGHYCGVNGDCGRFVEIWNLVFIQYNRDETGALTPLPARHVDTGMGFERMVRVLQNAASNYETDVFRPLIGRIADMSGQAYSDRESGMAFRVIADHVRALTFAIADGALPSNEGRGYVLRRILRRAARYCRTLETREPFIYRLVPTLVETMGDAYPEIRAGQDRIMQTIRAEEEAFGRTLDRGLEHFEEMVRQSSDDGRDGISGADAFRLYDTYGFPLDLTQLVASERNLTVDLAGFEREMEQQRSRSRSGVAGAAGGVGRFDAGITEIAGARSEFLGYKTLEVDDAEVVFSDDEWVVLAATPFYAESGGQVGDTGELITQDGTRFGIIDTVKQGEAIAHRRDPEDRRALPVGARVKARVDGERRRAIMRNHTATHLLHAALRATLGAHVHQRGSEVAPDRLRFDFAHQAPVTPEQLDTIERMVNERIWEDRKVDWFETDLDEARALGAMALFTEKYGDRVRVVRVDDFSLELCGGTHLGATGEVGPFRIVRESSVAAGERRIEAITGEAAYEAIKTDERILRQAAAALKTDPTEMARRAEALQERVRELEREIKRLRGASTSAWLDRMLSEAVSVDGVTVAGAQVECPDMDTLRVMGDTVRGKLPGAGVGALFSIIDGRPVGITVVTDQAITTRRLNAGTLAREIAGKIGGGGGGKTHMAQVGGKDPEKIDEALSALPDIVRSHLSTG